MSVITGVGVSSGRAVGPLVRMPDPVSEPAAGGVVPEDDRIEQAGRIDIAAATVKADLESKATKAKGKAKALLEATAMMAADPTLATTAKAKVAKGVTPERAVWDAGNEVAAMLTSLGGYMAERAHDIEDVRNRVVAALMGRPAPGVPVMHEPFVLCGVDLAPADTATLDPELTVALVTSSGGPTSHTAILAKALGLPAIVACEDILSVPEGTTVLVDGSAGKVTLSPTDEQIARVKASKGVKLEFSGVGATSDGHRVQLLANVGGGKDAAAAVIAKAEGIGLFRSEFCFLDRNDAPTVEEQVDMYLDVFEKFPGKKVVIRTLDAGADKPLPFITNMEEENPALGVRGYRTSWKSPQVLTDQLEAIAQAQSRCEAKLWVMAPMIDTYAETVDFIGQCKAKGLETAGIMIETPAAAITADTLLQVAEFASLGTNDLGQYTMAADRLMGELAALNDPWQPAVLRLIKASCEGGAANDRPVGVCGEAASDPALAVVLTGLGVASLSMTSRALAAVGTVLSKTSFAECQRLAALACAAKTATEAKDSVRAELTVLEELGL